MNYRVLALSVLASAVTQFEGCPESFQDDADAAAQAHYATPQPYGVDGTLTRDQAAWLEGLTFPQTYEAMEQTFGFPAFRSVSSDIYKVEGGGQVEVFYDSNGLATGYSRN